MSNSRKANSSSWSTLLFVPGDRPERFAKAAASGADAIIIDLEDAVRSESKGFARVALSELPRLACTVFVRINPVGSAEWAPDLAAVAGAAIDGVVVPKAEEPRHLAEVARNIGAAKIILPQIESARGLDNARDLIAAEGVVCAVFGHLDFSADLGCAPESDIVTFARAMLVYQSRLANKAAPIDSVTVDLSSESALLRDAQRARDFGFGGKLLIHPKQVEPVRRAFEPTTDELTWASRVLEAAEASPSGALLLDGKMIDKPVLDAARRTLARANKGVG